MLEVIGDQEEKEVGISTEKTLSTDIHKATKNPIKHKKNMQAVPVLKTNRIAMWRYIFEFAEPRPLVRILHEMFGK